MSAARGHHHDQAVPVPALWAALVLIVVSITLAAVARGDLQARSETAQLSVAPARAEKLLRFEDRPDGAIVVVDHRTGAVERVLDPAGHGFIRGVMRGLFRARKIDGVPREGPFRLAREADGRLTLTDAHTRRTIDLQAFGPSNLGAFAQLLDGTGAHHAP